VNSSVFLKIFKYVIFIPLIIFLGEEESYFFRFFFAAYFRVQTDPGKPGILEK